MRSFSATIHANEESQVDLLAENTYEAIDFVNGIYKGLAPVKLEEITIATVATKIDGEWVTRKVIPTTDELVKKLWVIADGVGQRDSLDTFAQLASLILLLERK